MALPSKDQYLSELEPTDCPICLTTITEPTSTACRHFFCLECLKAWLAAHKDCPTCRQELYKDPAESEEDIEMEDEAELPDSISLDRYHLRALLGLCVVFETDELAAPITTPDWALELRAASNFRFTFAYDTSSNEAYEAYYSKFIGVERFNNSQNVEEENARVALEAKMRTFFATGRNYRLERSAVSVAHESGVWEGQCESDRDNS